MLTSNIDFSGSTTNWMWDTKKYILISSDTPFNPERAYWLYLHGDDSSNLEVRGIISDGVITLHKGWNFVGIVHESSYPENPNIRGSIWWWNSEEQQLRRLSDAENIIPGRGYWIYSKDSINKINL